MRLNFSGICGSKQQKNGDVQQPVRQPKQKPASHKVQSPTRKDAPINIDDEKELDEFIKGIQRQTTELETQNKREMTALQKEFAQHQQRSDRLAKLFEPQYDSDIEKELADLEKQVDN